MKIRIEQLTKEAFAKYGEVVEADLKPGLHFKVPLMNEVRRFDARVQVDRKSHV